MQRQGLAGSCRGWTRCRRVLGPTRQGALARAPIARTQTARANRARQRASPCLKAPPAAALSQEALSEHDHLEPDLFTYKSLLTPCIDTGDQKTAFVLHDQLLSNGITPDTEMYNILIRVCTRAGDYDAAEGVFSQMRQQARRLTALQPPRETARPSRRCAGRHARADSGARWCTVVHGAPAAPSAVRAPAP